MSSRLDDDDVVVLEPAAISGYACFTHESVYWWPLHAEAVEREYRWSICEQSQFCCISAEKESILPFMGRRYHALKTNGNGSCAIHSVFGKPDAGDHDRLFVQHARQRAIETMGQSALQFRGRLQDDVLFDSVTSCIWGDYLLPVLYRENNIDNDMPIFD